MSSYDNSPFAPRPSDTSPGEGAPDPVAPAPRPSPPAQETEAPKPAHAAQPTPTAQPPSPPPAPQPAYQPPPSYAPPQGYPVQGYPQQPAQNYAPPGYGSAPQQSYAPPMSGGWQGHYPLATWGERVVAALFDALLQLPALVLYLVGLILMVANAPTTRNGRVISPGNGGLVTLGLILTLLGAIAILAIAIWNRILRQGRTGQSWGKSKRGLRLISMKTHQPLGPGMTFVRELAHGLDSAAYVGYLWPLWDPQRQTFADKILDTVVVKER